MAMAEAVVGDDVFGEDETVNTLQEEVAQLLGKAAGLFVPSGTMGNQLAIKSHTQPGDEIICEADSHIRRYEAAGAAFHSQAQLFPIEGELGVLSADQVEAAINSDNVHLPPTGLIVLENTHNQAGGTIFPLEGIVAIRGVAEHAHLPMHLDGARLLNAVVATGIPADEWAANFDSVSICFSKGLGAPVGSVLCGSRAFIETAHRYRKLFGGGMRQVGIIAAGALFALRHNIENLERDHEHAQQLAEELVNCEAVRLDMANVHTNIIIFGIDPQFATAKAVEARLGAAGVLAFALGPDTVRLVTHSDLTDHDIDQARQAFRKVFA